MRIRDWSSDVCSSDLTSWSSAPPVPRVTILEILELAEEGQDILIAPAAIAHIPPAIIFLAQPANEYGAVDRTRTADDPAPRPPQGPAAERGHAFCLRSEEHTSELQSLMRISYAVFCLKKKITCTQ